jgi:hypothetical protein
VSIILDESLGSYYPWEAKARRLGPNIIDYLYLFQALLLLGGINVKTASSITVIGVGTLGGFLCESLSKVESVKKIVVIDYDRVRKKNIPESVYPPKSVGNSKVYSIKKIIKFLNPNIEVIGIKEKYIEGKTKLSVKTDLVFDCRDFIYDRNGEIDSRLFITGRYIVLDCRRKVTYNNHFEGSYNQKVTRLDLSNAANIASSLVENGKIFDIVEKELVHKVELDYVSRKTHEILQEKDNMVAIPDPKFIDLEDSLHKILENNKKGSLKMFLGSKESSLMFKEIQKGTLNSSKDVVSLLSQFVQSPFASAGFIVVLHEKQKEVYLELLPETGAA